MPELCKFCRQIAEENEKLHAKLVNQESWLAYWKSRFNVVQNDAGVAKAMLRDEQRYNAHLKPIKQDVGD
tara:strand:- start:9929 stop:10138 length:210 start_codon:yes stop_codon:yes gene_type:complete